MAQFHNPTFKPPLLYPSAERRPLPSPRDFVEPLSPTKPKPRVLEPFYNYPPIDPPNVHYAHVATPRARTHSLGHTSVHRQTPSTIDTLAEAALATSPSHETTHHRHSPVGFGTNGKPPANSIRASYGMSEPPHKRAKSELLPSPYHNQFISRPATSYEPHAWAHPTQAGNGYNSRVEEAALLLNFQSGGLPAGNDPPQPPHPLLTRPHANKDGYHLRPSESTSQSSLLPPFDPQESRQALTTLPSPHHVVEKADAPSTIRDPPHGVSPVFTTNNELCVPPNAEEQAVAHQPQEPQNARTPLQAPSVDGARIRPPPIVKPRRGWPKGKPRGPGNRKTLAEKAATKRAAARKKTPESKANRAKSDKRVNDLADNSVRRKSLSDIRAAEEHRQQQRDARPTTTTRATSVPPHVAMTIRERSPPRALRRKPAVHADTICAGCLISRGMAKPHGELDEWICCNGCRKWYHIDCAGFKKAHEIRDVDKFFCTPCEPEHGKTTFVRKSTRAHSSVDYAELQRGVLKTSEESVEHHYIQPIKDGTFQFDPEVFPRLRPEMVTKDFLEKSGTFVEPICIPAEWNPRPWARYERTMDSEASEAAHPEVNDHDGEILLDGLLPDDFEYAAVPDYGQDRLDMVMPEGLTVRHVCNLVGPDTPLDVIDVKTQNSGSKWTLSRWADYYEEDSDEKAIRNVISLEVSQTRLGRLLQRPKIVRDIDLQDDVWPQEEFDKGKWPKVQFYCLMSVADSYTDFHIDFGGSSVYYHILKGKKTFFFIPPKTKHLKAYEEWNDSPQQNYTFLPHITRECYRVDLSEGDTMLIPSGWIHAVWTPEDSLVVGGNFLNRMSYKNQFRVVDIEKANETPMKFRYPFFQKIMWYTAIKYLRDDPLPPAVSQLLYDGQRFERKNPVWSDFDTDGRCYSQAEVEGLPELVNFIFRTVMVVLGRVEGISQDRMKRVGASIPKGHGEPLELAKTFALWVAWKRGNEDPPAWAHPNAVLPNNTKDDGPPKKLSERKLRELERREAVSAWRTAPDRQSARVMSKNAANAAAAAAAATAATAIAATAAIPVKEEDRQPSTPVPAPVPAPASASVLIPATLPPGIPYQQPHGTPYYHRAPSSTVDAATPGQHLSTPKTSVLGPKRVACDACRKRRIRCKHKDVVVQASTPGMGRLDDASPSFTSQPPDQDFHDTIAVASLQHDATPVSFVNTVVNGSTMPMTSDVPPKQLAPGSDQLLDPELEPHQQAGKRGPLPGTNAYVSAHIPMTMNGEPFFGDTPKRGRSKACYECRKSKRRCIHDENGNVDPVKAAEVPVPRSVGIKKRPLGSEDSPHRMIKRRRSCEDGQTVFDAFPSVQTNGYDVLQPSNGPSYQPVMMPMANMQSPSQMHGNFDDALPPLDDGQHQTQQHLEHPEIDPNLLRMQNESQGIAVHGTAHESYPTTNTDPQQPCSPYQLPSLEEIANEVLVDMTGNEFQSEPDATPQQSHLHEHMQLFNAHDGAPPRPDGLVKTEERVDSAASIPNVLAETDENIDSAASMPEVPPKTDESVDSAASTIKVLAETDENTGSAASMPEVPVKTDESIESAASMPDVLVKTGEDDDNADSIATTSPKIDVALDRAGSSPSSSHNQSIPDVSPKVEEAIDSAISVSSSEQLNAERTAPNGHAGNPSDRAAADTMPSPTHRSVEPSAEPLPNAENSSLFVPMAKPVAADANNHSKPAIQRSNGASSLPLYKPPAPLPHSPKTSRRGLAPNGYHYQPVVIEGASPPLAAPQPKPPTPPVPNFQRRKRDSLANKKIKVEPGVEARIATAKTAVSQPRSTAPSDADDSESMQLARLLQQQDLGLRRRGK